MKKTLLNLGGSILSNEQMKSIKGGNLIWCSYTACWGGDCVNITGACAYDNVDDCSWACTDQPGADSVSNIECC